MARSGTYGTKQNKVEDCRQWPMHHQGGGLSSVAYAPPRWRTVVSGLCTIKVEDCCQWPMHHQGGGLLSVAYAPPRWRTVVSGLCTTKVQQA
jgi:uncharacterized membrane protein